MFDFNISKISNSRLNKTIQKNREKLTPKTELNAMYIGLVEDTNDPRGLGRIKVRIPALHGTNGSQSYYMPTKQIPWATPALLNGGTNDMGQYIIPVKGSQVMISFELNSFNKPVYFGTVPSNTSGKTKYYNDNNAIYSGNSIDIKNNDRIKDLNNSGSNATRAARKTDKEKMTTGKTVLYKSLKGATIMIDDSDGSESIVFMDANGQVLRLGNNSGTALPRRGNKTTPSSGASTYMSLSNGQGDAVTVTKGNINIKTSNNELIDLDDGKINISISTNDSINIEDGKIIIINSNNDKLVLNNGKASIETSNGEKVSLENNKINIKSGNNEIELSGSDSISISNGTSTVALNSNIMSMSNGTSSVTLNGGNTNISNGTSTISINGGNITINGSKVWTDNYHPGV